MHETGRRRRLSPRASIEDEIAQLRDLDLKGLREPPRDCRRPFGLGYAAMAGCFSMA